MTGVERCIDCKHLGRYERGWCQPRTETCTFTPLKGKRRSFGGRIAPSRIRHTRPHQGR